MRVCTWSRAEWKALCPPNTSLVMAVNLLCTSSTADMNSSTLGFCGRGVNFDLLKVNFDLKMDNKIRSSH